MFTTLGPASPSSSSSLSPSSSQFGKLDASGSSTKSSTLSVMRFTKLTPIVSCENLADMDQPVTAPPPPPPPPTITPPQSTTPNQPDKETTTINFESTTTTATTTTTTTTSRSPDMRSPSGRKSIATAYSSKQPMYNSQIKRKSTGLIESVTRVNVSDGILASGSGGSSVGGASSPNRTKKAETSIMNENGSGGNGIINLPVSIAGTASSHTAGGRSFRSASASVVPPAVASLDNLVAFPIAVLGSSSSTDNDNEPTSATSVEYNSDEDTLVNIRSKFASAGTSPRAMVRYLATRNAALASSNSSLNGSLSSATSTATKLTVKIKNEFFNFI